MAHNGTWGTLAAFTATSSPVMVDEYLAGDNGVLILSGTVLVTLWLAYKLRHRLDHPKTRRLWSRWHRRWQELHRRTTWKRRCTQAIGESDEADEHFYG
jgi:hypothetical protein